MLKHAGRHVTCLRSHCMKHILMLCIHAVTNLFASWVVLLCFLASRVARLHDVLKHIRHVLTCVEALSLSHVKHLC